MGQGARITGNLLHDNSNDLMLEVNHGPFLVDNNLFLSERNLVAASGGGAYVHNLWCGSFSVWPNLENRLTPYFKPHSVDIIDRSAVDQQDERHYNNLFVNPKASLTDPEDMVHDDQYDKLFANNLGLCVYDQYDYMIQAGSNVYLPGSKPFKHEHEPLVIEGAQPQIRLQEKDGEWWLEMTMTPAWQEAGRPAIITSEMLGRAKISGAAYENPDGSPCCTDTDYLGTKHDAVNPLPGPFGVMESPKLRVRVWPKEQKGNQ
jgi:hypothetical protein